MVDFTCKQINANDLIKCTFGLNKTELRIFLFLLKSKLCINSSEIAKHLSLDRTTIQKGMKKMLEKGIVERRQDNLDSGGYVLLYCVKKKPELEKKMKEILASWKQNVDNELESVFGHAKMIE